MPRLLTIFRHRSNPSSAEICVNPRPTALMAVEERIKEVAEILAVGAVRPWLTSSIITEDPARSLPPRLGQPTGCRQLL